MAREVRVDLVGARLRRHQPAKGRVVAEQPHRPATPARVPASKGWWDGLLGCKKHTTGKYSKGPWKDKLVFFSTASNNAAENAHRTVKNKFEKLLVGLTEATWEKKRDQYALEFQWRLRTAGGDPFLALLEVFKERRAREAVGRIARQLFQD